MMKTKCAECTKQFLSYEPGDLCPVCGKGLLMRGWREGEVLPKKAPLSDSKFFKQRSSFRNIGRSK